MKTVTLTVRVSAIVPDDAPTQSLCLYLPDGVEVTDTKGKVFADGIETYETVEVTEHEQ